MVGNGREIAIVVPGFEIGGGVPEVARFLCKVARRSGFSVKLVSLAMSAADPLSLRILKPTTWMRIRCKLKSVGPMEIYEVGCYGCEIEFQRYRRRRALDQLLKNSDVIQVVSGSPAWANCVIGIGPPVSLQVATLAKVERRRRLKIEGGLSGIWRRLMTLITHRLDLRALKLVDAIQVENKWMYEFVTDLNRKEKKNIDIRYIPPGIDTETFKPLRDGKNSGDPYVLCVGRLQDPRKNVEMLLEAFKIVAEKNKDVRLITAGLSPPPVSYFERASKFGLSNRIYHLDSPSKERLIELYQNASVFVLPSDEEGLGLVLLEAMACGVPAVATKCGGPEDVIKHGINGFLVERNDAMGMAKCIEELLYNRDLWNDMSLAARQEIEEHYSEDVAGRHFLDVWECLLKKKSA